MDAALQALTPQLSRRLPDPVAEVVEYALAGPGKRVRGVLMLLAHEAAGGARDVAPLAAAVEVVHAYSLVHDDLPCMDDDEMRRGRATVHRRFGVEAATVAGVAMVPLAVIAAATAGPRAGLPQHVSATIVNELMRAAGGGGMIGGQLLDLEAEGRALDLAGMDRLHSAKTGALFAAAARIGGIAAEADARRVDALTSFGGALGLAFQITDDVLDVTASAAQLGKDAGRDAALHKSTYPAAIGVAAAAARARTLVDDACADLAAAGIPTDRLGRFAGLAVTRDV
ncbi:MAG TPA: polyprenyl synthetase family protein [Gemmatimonadaceae bacterium]